MRRRLLKDVLANIHSIDRSLALYVPKDEALSTSTVVELMPWEDPDSPRPEGTRSFLTIDDIIDVLDAWSAWRGGKAPSDEERISAVAYYEKHDAFMPVV